MNGEGSIAGRATLDVSELPGSAYDTRSPVWWGNLLLMMIETTTVALLVAAYFYVASRTDPFPPPRVDSLPPIGDPLPRLGSATVSLLLLLASVPLMIRADRRVRRKDERATKSALLACLVLVIVSTALRIFDFDSVHFGWNANAYASVVWGMLVMHLVYLVVAIAEIVFSLGTMSLYDLDENLSVDVTLVAAYWYWTVGAWVVLYLVIYWAPRVL
jgi:cytochrome c oxidase subunit 3